MSWMRFTIKSRKNKQEGGKLVSDKMSKEDMVKEAVEEAKAKAAEVDEPQTGQEETAEQDTEDSENAEEDSQPTQRKRNRPEKQTARQEESGSGSTGVKSRKEETFREKE